MRNPGLTGRVALVTGANHGIGAAISRELAGNGVHIVATYLRMTSTDLDSEQYPAGYGEARGAAADVVVADVEARGGKAVGVEVDLCAPEAPARLFDLAEKEFGTDDAPDQRAGNPLHGGSWRLIRSLPARPPGFRATKPPDLGATDGAAGTGGPVR